MEQERFLLKPATAAEVVDMSESLFRKLMRTDARLRECLVEIPGVRGVRVHKTKLAAWADSLPKVSAA